MTRDDFLDIEINEKNADICNSIMIGKPRLQFTSDPELYTATIVDWPNDEQILIGSYKTRRESVGEVMQWAYRLIAKLESYETMEWIMEEESHGKNDQQ